MEIGVTKVSTTLTSTLNAEHMLSRILMGKMLGQPLEARLIKWKLRLLWKNKYKEDRIIKVISQPLGNVLKVDDVTLSFNGVFVKVLVEVDLRGRMRSDGHVCPEYEVNDGCFLIKKLFKDEPAIFPKDTNVDTDIKDALHDNALFPCCFATRGGLY
ncbi:hypothetical protein ACFX11_025100 [Malus domestica]